MRDHDYHDAVPDDLDEQFRAIVGDDHQVDDDDLDPTATRVLIDYVLDHADQLDDGLVDLARHGVLVIDDRLADHFRAVATKATRGIAARDPLT